MSDSYNPRLELDIRAIPFMDGATQKLYDFSGHARHGTPSGFASDVEYEDVVNVGQVINIATPKYINHGQVLNYTVEDFSFEIVLNIASYGIGPIFISNGLDSVSGYYIRIGLTGALAIGTSQLGAAQYTSSVIGVITLNNYNHIIISRSGAQCRFFVNGREVSYSAVGTHSNPTNSLNDLLVGSYTAPGFELNGRILYYKSRSRAIGATEAWEHYNNWLRGAFNA